jgi:transcriptional regulator with XRE-family HTH domain
MADETESRLRAVRMAQDLGLREAARRADLDPGELSRIERGKQRASVSAMKRIGRVLGLKDLVRVLDLWWPGE